MVHNRAVLARVIAIAVLTVLLVAGCGGKQTRVEQPKPRVIIQGSSILIVNDADETIPIEIPFSFNSDTLEEESYGALDALAMFLETNIDLTLIEVQGHSDNRGTPKHNQQLSARRAKSVVEYLVGKGIESSRLRSKGFGAKQPAATGADESSWRLNRRVEFVIVGRGETEP